MSSRTCALMLSTSCALLIPALAQASSPTIAELEEHLARLQNEYNGLIARLHAIGAERDRTQQLIDKLEQRLTSAPDQLGETWQQLHRARIYLDRVLAAFDRAQEELIILMPRIRRVQRLIDFLRDDEGGGD